MKKGSITHERVPVRQLKLDTENPRVAQWIDMYGEEVTDEHMKLALQRGGSDDKALAPVTGALRNLLGLIEA